MTIVELLYIFLSVNGAETLSPVLILRRYGADCNFKVTQNIQNSVAWPISPQGILMRLL